MLAKAMKDLDATPMFTASMPATEFYKQVLMPIIKDSPFHGDINNSAKMPAVESFDSGMVFFQKVLGNQIEYHANLDGTILRMIDVGKGKWEIVSL